MPKLNANQIRQMSYRKITEIREGLNLIEIFEKITIKIIIRRMINVGQQVVTSKGRYGRVIDVDNSSNELKVLVKIGTKNYWILESQLTPATHIVRVKVEYEIDYCGKSITDSLEVALKRDTVLYNDNVNYLAQLCKDKVERQLEMEVKVKQIKIS